MTTKSRWQNRDGQIIERTVERTATAVQAMRDAGWVWVNMCDDLGWRPSVFVWGELERAEWLAAYRAAF